MLLKYSVSNFKSIGHNVEFSMFPLENTDDRFLTEIETVAGTWKILKRGAFFGPNASGKTSFVKSLAFAKDFIVKGTKKLSIFKSTQFRGNIEELDGITSFEFMIYVDGEVYDYGFSIKNSYINEEWLMVLSTNGFESLFERKTNRLKNTNIEYDLNKLCQDDRESKLIEVLRESIGENQANSLFLYKLAVDFEYIIPKSIISWFRNITIIYPDSQIKDLPKIIKYQKDFREFISQNLTLLDTGVNSITARTKRIDILDFANKFSISEEILNNIQEAQNGFIEIYGKLYYFGENKNSMTMIEIKLEHFLNGELIPFDIQDESDGTQRLLDILPVLYILNQQHHSIFIIDELDRSFHTKLSRYFVHKFEDKAVNQQLLFTAHDTNLIDERLLRNEEIWFVDKNKNGETNLKPFSDFDVRENQNILKDYLAGRFGAIPVIKEEI
ncbi:MAG: ATP-binding protein [Oscillospiraceae bacterium]|nr:ATP-binding protein [Oscillospiraceae bacterium]